MYLQNRECSCRPLFNFNISICNVLYTGLGLPGLLLYTDTTVRFQCLISYPPYTIYTINFNPYKLFNNRQISKLDISRWKRAKLAKDF